MPTGMLGRAVKPPKPALGKDSVDQTNRWLIKAVYQELRRNRIELDDEQIQDFCWRLLVSKNRVQSTYDAVTGGQVRRLPGGRITDTQADSLISSVSRFVRDNYDPARFSQIQHDRAMKRRKFTLKALVPHLSRSNTEVAEALGCSTRTVSRLRKTLAGSPLGRLTVLLTKARTAITRSEESRAHGYPEGIPNSAPDAHGRALGRTSVSDGEGRVHRHRHHGPGTSGGDPAAGVGRLAGCVA